MMQENQNKENITQEKTTLWEKHWLKFAIAIPFVVILLGIILGMALPAIDTCLSNFFFGEEKQGGHNLADSISLAVEIIVLPAGIATLYFFYQRMKHQEQQINQQYKQIDLQIDQRVDDRFNAAVGLLGSSKNSARTGAIYSLYQLACEEDKYRRPIGQILCSHIRSKTQNDKYQAEYKERPSNEIQTTIDLLFKENGLYQQFKVREGLDQADLSRAYLVGVSFEQAQCQGVNFSSAQCRGADFREAQCQRTNFREAWCQKAHFYNAQCQGANFLSAQCQGTNFWYAQYQGANFEYAQCQGAHFSSAQCQGVKFARTRCQGANFMGTQCQEADFTQAKCQGANFEYAQYQGAIFMDTQCQGAHTRPIYHSLEDRIGKDSQLENMVFAGEVDDKTVQSIENAKEYLSDYIYERLQKIVKENKGKAADHTLPDGIITGVLENSEELQAIIRRDWEKLEAIKQAAEYE